MLYSGQWPFFRSPPFVIDAIFDMNRERLAISWTNAMGADTRFLAFHGSSMAVPCSRTCMDVRVTAAMKLSYGIATRLPRDCRGTVMGV